MEKNVYHIGLWSACLTAVLTLITFAIAIYTPPLSGPYCIGECFTYPYTDIISRFPRDYIWMYAAILLSLVFYVLMTTIHFVAPEKKKIWSHIGLSFALISTAVFVIDYFLQLSVIQPSLLKGETDGIALLSQFNAHGVFIVLEEIGFIMMSLSLFFISFIFSGKTKIEKAIQWIFIICFVLNIIAFTFYTVFYGIFREYRFEVATISIHWLTLLVSGILLSIFYKKRLQELS
jgi:hypothetical protein